MGRVLPIFFNTDMVRAILEGRKTVTRRTVRHKYGNTEMKMLTDKYGTRLIEIQKDVEGETYGRDSDERAWRKLLPYIEKNPQWKKGDILYVRETWAFLPCVECMREGEDCGRPKVMYEDKHSESEGCFVYRADHPQPERVSWTPSIHMPKEAARIWIKVKYVRMERLQDMDTEDNRNYIAEGAGDKQDFIRIWDSTVKDKERYSWDASPWVWAIAFERCEKPEISR